MSAYFLLLKKKQKADQEAKRGTIFSLSAHTCKKDGPK
jgi:hypothetical protein